MNNPARIQEDRVFRVERIVADAQTRAVESGSDVEHWRGYVSDQEAAELADMGVAL